MADALAYAEATAKAASTTRDEKGRFVSGSPEKSKSVASSDGAKTDEGKQEPAKQEKAAGDAPKSEQATDLSHLPEDVRKALEGVSAESLKTIKELTLKGQDYTKKTMTVAEERKALEQRKADLELVDWLKKNPKGLEAAYEAVKNGSARNGTPEKSDEPDWTKFDFTSVEGNDQVHKALRGLFERWFEERAAKLPIEDQVESILNKRIAEPMKQQRVRATAALEWGRLHGLEATDIEKIVGAADQYGQAIGGTTWSSVEPDKIAAWLDPFRGIVNGKSTSHAPNPAASKVVEQARVAAPGGGVGVAQAIQQPAFMLAKKDPRVWSDRERTQAAAFWLRNSGIDVTESDLEGIRH